MTPHSLSPDAPAGAASGRLAVASLSLSILLSSLGTSIANVGLPAMAVAFGAAFQDVQWIVLAYLLAITTLIVGAGRLGDMFGRRRLLLVGIGLFTLASAACGLAPTLPALIAARAAQGAGAAIMMALSMAMVGETVPRGRTGAAMGLLGTMSAIGTALGPSLGGLLVSAFGWRALFLAGLIPDLVTLALAWRFLPRGSQPDSVPTRFDLPGTILLALSIGAYALAMTIGRGHFGQASALLLVAALLGAVLFVQVETKVPAPLVRLDLFRSPGLATGLATGLLVMTGMMTTLVVGPFYLSGALHMGTAAAGAAMSVGPVVSALTGLPAGRLADRFGTLPMIKVGLAGIVAGTLTFALLPVGAGVAGYLCPLVLTTAGYALFQAANNTAVTRDVAPGERGLIAGLLHLSRNLGLVTGASVMGALFAYASNATDLSAAPPADIALGARTTFAAVSTLALVALALASRSRTAQAADGQPSG